MINTNFSCVLLQSWYIFNIKYQYFILDKVLDNEEVVSKHCMLNEFQLTE